MPSEPEALADGTFGVVNDAGEILQLNADGVLLAAFAPDGTPLEIDSERFGYDPEAESGLVDLWADETDAAPGGEDLDAQRAALEERLAALEQRAAEPPVLNTTPVAIETDLEVLSDRWAADEEILEHELGRRLTLREKQLLFAEAEDALDRGESGDLISASERLAWTGGLEFHDLENDTSRQEFMAARLRDSERLARSQELGDDDLRSEHEPVRQGLFDRDDDGERQAGMVAKLQGHDVAFYDGSQQPDLEEQ